MEMQEIIDTMLLNDEKEKKEVAERSKGKKCCANCVFWGRYIIYPKMNSCARELGLLCRWDYCCDNYKEKKKIEEK